MNAWDIALDWQTPNKRQINRRSTLKDKFHIRVRRLKNESVLV